MDTSSDGSRATALAVLNQTPWCAKLLADPAFSLVRMDAITPEPGTDDTFFKVTLATPSTISACVAQQRDPVGIAAGGHILPPLSSIREVRTFFTIGSGVNGHRNIAHGGFTSAIIDEAMGNLIAANKDFDESRAREANEPYNRAITMTVTLNLRYRKPVPTPSTILIRTLMDRVEGRKQFVSASVESGSGEVYTEATAVFVSVRGPM